MNNQTNLRAPKPLSPVHVAKPSDLGYLVDFLSGLRGEIEGGDIDDDLLLSLAKSLTHGKDGIAFIVRGDQSVEASLGILFEKRPLARTCRLRVVWNLVAPSKRRKTGHAASILRAAVRFADTLNRPIYVDSMGSTPAPIELCLKSNASTGCPIPSHYAQKCGLAGRAIDLNVETCPQARLYSRHLLTAGRIFAHFPEKAAAQ
jgi:hypothetical protein